MFIYLDASITCLDYLSFIISNSINLISSFGVCIGGYTRTHTSVCACVHMRTCVEVRGHLGYLPLYLVFGLTESEAH